MPNLDTPKILICGSARIPQMRQLFTKQIPLGALTPGVTARALFCFKPPLKEFESSQNLSSNSNLSTFLASLRFEKRNLLDVSPKNLWGFIG